MKYRLLFILACLAPAFFVACGNQKKGYDMYASSPTSLACLHGAASCDNSIYSQYSQYGFIPYPGGQQTAYNNNYGYGGYNGGYNPATGLPNNTYATGGLTGNYCSCPMGTRPVYNGQIGLGCVSNMMISQYQAQAYYYGAGGSTNNLVNWNQISNQGGIGSAGGCYSNLAWACFVDAQSSCFQGYRCQQIHNASRLGICIK